MCQLTVSRALQLPSADAVDAVLETLQAVTALVSGANRDEFVRVFAGAVELCEGTPAHTPNTASVSCSSTTPNKRTHSSPISTPDLGAVLPLLLSGAGAGRGHTGGSPVVVLVALRRLFPAAEAANASGDCHLLPVGPRPPGGAGVTLPVADLGTWALLSQAACSLASCSNSAQPWQHYATLGLWTPQAATALGAFIQVGGQRLQRAACRCIRSAALSLGRNSLPRAILVSAIAVALTDRCSGSNGGSVRDVVFTPGGAVDEALGVALQECVGVFGPAGGHEKDGGEDTSPRFVAPGEEGFAEEEALAEALAPFATALAPIIIRDAPSVALRAAVTSAALTSLRGNAHTEATTQAHMPAQSIGASRMDSDGDASSSPANALLARATARACLDVLSSSTAPVAQDRRAALASLLAAALARAGGFGPEASSAVARHAADAAAPAAASLDDPVIAEPPQLPSAKRRRLRKVTIVDDDLPPGLARDNGAAPMAVDGHTPAPARQSSAPCVVPSPIASDTHDHVLATLKRLSPPVQQAAAASASEVLSQATLLTTLSCLSILCSALAAAPRDCQAVQRAAACASAWCTWAGADKQTPPHTRVRSAILDVVLSLLSCDGAAGNDASSSTVTPHHRTTVPTQLVISLPWLRAVAWQARAPTANAIETPDDIKEAVSACGSRALAVALALRDTETCTHLLKNCVTAADLPPLRAAAAVAAPCAVAHNMMTLSDALAALSPLANDTHKGVCISLGYAIGGLMSASAAIASGGTAAASAQAFAARSGPALVLAAATSGGHVQRHCFASLDACVAAVPSSTGHGALPLTGPGWRPFLERFWFSASTTGAGTAGTGVRPPPDEALAAGITSSVAICRHASVAHLAGAAHLLTGLASLASHTGRVVRLAACSCAHVLALPPVLAAAYPTLHDADSREVKLLDTYRSLFQPQAGGAAALPALEAALPSAAANGGGAAGGHEPAGSSHQPDWRDTGLRTFTSVGIALNSRNADAGTVSICVACLDDPNWAVRAAALGAIRTLAAARRAPSLRAFVLAQRKVLAFVGENLGRRPRLTAQLAGALGMSPTVLLATQLLPAALPSLVASNDEAALRAAAAALGQTPAELLAQNVQYVMADLIERVVLYGQNSGQEQVQPAQVFVERITGRSLVELVTATREELIEVLLENVGADPDISTADAGAKLRKVLNTLMVNFGQGGAGGAAAPGGGSAAEEEELAAFMQGHITGLLKHTGDALVAAAEASLAQNSGGDAGGDITTPLPALIGGGPDHGAATSNASALSTSAALQPAAAALRSLRVLLALMGASAFRFAPKVMCLLSRVLAATTASGSSSAATSAVHHHLRVHALYAAKDLAVCLAHHAPRTLPLFASPLVVLCLPFLPGSTSSQDDGPTATAAAAAAVDVVTFLVLGTGDALKGHLGSLPTLPSSGGAPALGPVVAAIQAERGSLSLAQRLHALAASLRHESLAVRAIAAAEATREVRRAPPGAVAASFTTHPRESNGFLAALLACCTGDSRASEAQRVVHVAALQCLAELGALDPARVSLVPTPPPRAFVPSDADFGAALIEHHVARLMRGASDPQQLDIAAYACQELLRYFRDAKLVNGSQPNGAGGGSAAPPPSSSKGVHTRGNAGNRRSSANTAAASGGGAQAASSSEFDALWQRLRPDTRELVEPCLSSKYFVTSTGGLAPHVAGAGPLFTHRSEPPYRRWLQLWCRALISLAASSPRAKIFEAVTSILRFDIDTMLFLLPHLVLAALCYGGPGARAQVTSEIVAVLSEAAKSGGAQDTSLASTATPHGTAAPADIDAILPGGLLAGAVLPPTATGRAALAAQTVFNLIDQLTTWLNDSRTARMARQQAAFAAAAGGTKKGAGNAPLGGALAAAAGVQHSSGMTPSVAGTGDADEKVVAELLKDIPRVLCARAAAAVGAAARALQYFEEHLRRRNRNMGLNNPASYQGSTPAHVPTSDAEVSFLGALYRLLEQPDALGALPKLRAVPCIADRVAQAEQGGDYGEAVAFFEDALHREAGSAMDTTPPQASALTDAEQGRMRCLWGLGQLSAVIRDVNALMPLRKNSAQELCAAGAAAAWRLGHWDALHTFCCAAGMDTLSSASPSMTNSGGSGGTTATCGGPFEGGGALTLAAALRAVQRSDAPGLQAAVRAGQEAALAPLAAAAMEGSYERAYPHLLRLHALHEVVAASEVLIPRQGAQLDEERVDALCATLDARLKAVQPTIGAREPLLALRCATLGLVMNTATQRQLALYSDSGPAKARQGARRAALATAKLCRASGAHGAAQLAVLKALAYGDGDDDATSRLEAAVEGARLLWDTGRGPRAVSDLQEALNAALGTSNGQLPSAAAAAGAAGGATQRLSAGGGIAGSGAVVAAPSIPARAMLLLARWAHETGQKQKSEVLELYGRITAAEPRWEAAYFYMAKYTDELLTDARRRERAGIAPQAVNPAALRALRAAAGPAGGGTTAGGGDVPERHTDYLVLTVRNYGLALRHGSKRIFQALPRMLTLWFDAPSLLEAPSTSGGHTSPAAAAACAPERRRRDKAIGEELKRTLATLLNDPAGRLPRTVWLTGLPVLISRICHKDADTAAAVRSLLADLAAAFPQHVLWSLATVSKSREQGRRAAAAEVLTGAKRACTVADKALFGAFAALVDNLVKLCNHTPKDPNAKVFSLASELSALKRCMPVALVVPVQAYLMAELPADGRAVCDDGHSSPFNPQAPTLVEVLDDVDVMHSMQKPKKLSVRGSDGLVRSFLAKPKDDLRKDLRMMEFVSLLNRVLAAEPASRKRRLYLRSFAVLPLTEDCGLIEWVPHTTGLRIVLQDHYMRANLFDRRTSNADAKAIYDAGEKSGRAPAETLRLMLRKYPPILHRFFPERFPDPAAWLAARTGFAHTAAVWSMVGHIVGLGDRHGENILVDTSTGDVVHVDFSYLFDKGLELDKPEVVPFRLTQNMIDAMGVAGPDGVFSSVCEITLGVLRQHRDALMSVLDTFVHDPLLEWTRTAKQQQQQGAGGAAHVAAALGGDEIGKSLELLARIRSRLEGVVVGVGAAPSLPLSTAGQARRLIEEAVSLDNLGRMYIWWMPWW